MYNDAFGSILNIGKNFSSVLQKANGSLCMDTVSIDTLSTRWKEHPLYFVKNPYISVSSEWSFRQNQQGGKSSAVTSAKTTNKEMETL